MNAPTNTRVALVTGGSSGIGRAVSRRLLDAGYVVVATGRDRAKLQALGEEVTPPASLVTCEADVTREQDVRRVVATTVEHFGRIDAVIASAGFSTHDRLDDGEPSGWERMLATNVLGPALVVHATLAQLKRTQGRYVLLGSIAGVKNTPGNMYSVSKWAVTALAENTRMMVVEDGVGVTLVAPGRVDSPFWAHRRSDVRDGAPAAPMLSPEGVADVIVWALAQPNGVDVNCIVVRPKGQIS